MANTPKNTIKTRKVAVLIADGFDDEAVSEVKQALLTAGAQALTVAPRLGILTGAGDSNIKADFSFLTGASVLFDAVYVPGGEASVSVLLRIPEAVEFINEAYKHCKTIAATGEGFQLLSASQISLNAEEIGEGEIMALDGVIVSRDASPGDIAEVFIRAIAEHRHWKREPKVYPSH